MCSVLFGVTVTIYSAVGKPFTIPTKTREFLLDFIMGIWTIPSDYDVKLRLLFLGMADWFTTWDV